MGCGQSKIHLYPRKSKSKTNGKKSGNVDMVDADAEEDDEGHKEAGEKDLNGHGKGQQYHLRNEDDDSNGLLGEMDGKGGNESGLNGEITIPMLRGKNTSLLLNHDILSSSQHNFFKMLDQKIDDGPDYDSTSETEIALEEARLNALVQHWESASISASMCSSASRSQQSTPIRQNTAPPSMRLMSPKRDQRVLPQTSLVQQQGYAPMPMIGMQQQQQQPQYQYQSQAIPGVPPSYLPQSYAPNAGPVGAAAAGMMRVGPRMLPVGGVVGGPQVSGVGNGLIGSALPQSSTIRIPVGYYSQHPSMMPIPHQMAYSATGAGMSIPQINPNQAYYGELMQHPLQVPQQQQQLQQQSLPQMNAMMGYNPLMGVVMDGSGSMVENQKVFPAAISVQRLAPQVQRQLRETQELIKDSCQGLVYGSPGPPPPPQQQQPKLLVQPGPPPSSGPPPPPQRTSTLRKNVNANAGAASSNSASVAANNNTSFETHSQDYS